MALMKLIESGALSEKQAEAVQNELARKAGIYGQGGVSNTVASRRGNDISIWPPGFLNHQVQPVMTAGNVSRNETGQA